jgi:hypothetical protein
MDIFKKEKILVLAKTYPSPSSKYIEPSCVAGITEEGEMRRLYPVPFKRLEDHKQFKKWQWVEAEVEENTQDHRKESRKIHFDNITLGRVIDVKNNWAERMRWIKQIPQIVSFEQEGPAPKINEDITLALFSLKTEVSLEITESSAQCTTEQLEELHRFDGENILSREDMHIPEKTLEKIPFDFYFCFVAKTNADTDRDVRLKIIDWEVCSLYHSCFAAYGQNWKAKFKERLEKQMNQCNLKLLIGNDHHLPRQWMIISLVYPPKQSSVEERQISLF